jgi:hypothetical protein
VVAYSRGLMSGFTKGFCMANFDSVTASVCSK